MTVEKLRTCTRKALAEMARQRGVPGWHAMRKDQLVKALVAKQNGVKSSSKPRSHKRSAPSKNSEASNNHNHTPNSTSSEQFHKNEGGFTTTGRSLARYSNRELPNGYGHDRIVLMVRDPYWLQAYWEITNAAVDRAQAALREEWHGAKPTLRVLDVTSEDTTSSVESHVGDIEVVGGANNWYINVSDPPRSFRVDIGYLTRQGRFFALAHSNVVNTPRAGLSDVIDENWVSVQEQFEKIYAMAGGFDPGASSAELVQFFQERMRRPVGSASISSFGSGGFAREKKRGFWFELDAELIVYGATEPTARVTLQGQPIQVRPDGTFTMRFGLPDKRLIIPATASSGDGNEERTIVLAVERNTKELEPVVHGGSSLQ